MGRSTVHYVDNKTNKALKTLHNKLRPAGTPVQRVEYIIELLLLRIFETKLKKEEEFKPLRLLFAPDFKWVNIKSGKEESNQNRLFSYLSTVSNDQILSELNDNFFPFYSSILTSARHVYKGNLPQKVQDQLVLIEEVFSNSNFTNNVNSGNLGEVISIVANDIEEARLLQTDLLGDAIESALSETGGTRDVGLFRTPDHIRQFMTAIIEPTFEDLIFDPACGTGGFLFDAFEFVMRRVDVDREWPGEKAHYELKDWFDSYFKSNPIDFPSLEKTTEFYRNGVTGIEYLGMIRKMAAINFYIRGLNPANIVQGDALAKFKPITDQESKSVVLANPPFGAQRDQEAYPDVWSEFSKESETTTLFVKLMFNHLKKGGRCAVVVSEGFLNWDQASSKALRRLLLEEAQLKAIISLPQGLFVSKNGQGPKTSILIFEKGGKTDWTWFYKVSNDGYTMGTNRKEQPGNQLTECLSLWHEFVKHGIKPPETKKQFCIPADWIKTLDPRIKEKIRMETRADFFEKGLKERVKKENELNKKVKTNKFTEADKQYELKIFDQMLENRLQNEIAKRIDKAHNYSFNLANYKSSLSDKQIGEWKDTLKNVEPIEKISLEGIYKKLKNGQPQNILPYLAKIDPTNAMEVNIIREYINNLDENNLNSLEELNLIKEVLASGAKYPIVKLKDYLILNRNKIKPKNTDIIYKVLGVNNEDGIFLNDKMKAEETNQSYFLVAKNEFCYNPYRINVGSIGLNNFDYENQIISGAYVVFGCKETELNPKYLEALFNSPAFLNFVNEKANGGVRMNFKFEYMEDWEIPLPPIHEQDNIVAKIERKKAMIQGIKMFINNWVIDDYLDLNAKEEALGNITKVDGQIIKDDKLLSLNEMLYIGGSNIETGTGRLVKIKTVKEAGISGPSYIFKSGQVVYSKVRPNLQKCFYSSFDGICSSDIYPLTVTDEDVFPEYLARIMQSKYFANKTLIFQGRAGMPKINRDQLATINIPIPGRDIQEKIVEEINVQMQLLEGLRKKKKKEQAAIQQILEDAWGMRFDEPIIGGTEDEEN